MSEKVLLKDGLLVDQKVLDEIQTRAAKNLLDRAVLAFSPGVFTTVDPTGALTSNDLQVLAGGGAATFIVKAGKGITANYDVVALSADTADVAIPNDSAFHKVIATYNTSNTEAGTLAATTGSNTWTGTGTSFTTRFAAGSYFRVSNSGAGNNGTYQVLAVASDTSLTTTVNALGTTETGLIFSKAGKFFPGYPITGTTDIAQFNFYTISLQAIGYTPTSDELYLADVKNAAGVITITDRRTALAPIIKGLQVADSHVSSTAAIAESKIALSTGLTNAKNWAHQQNTDTFTSAPIYRVGGSTGLRVLTEADLPRVVVNTGGSTMPTVLPTEVNLVTTFVNTTTDSSNPVPILKASWSITGTGSYSAGVVTVTSHSNTVAALNSGDLTNFVLVDSAGRLYKITGNSSVTTNTATSFTVNVVIDTGASQPNPANGAVTIRVYAASYAVRVTPIEDDNVTYLVQNRKTFVADVDSNGSLLTGLTTGTSIAGKMHKIELVASNATLTPTSTIVTQNKAWGAAVSGTVVNVPSASIAALATANTVSFSWPAPTGFDTKTMDYRCAHTIDGTSPSTFVDVPAEPPSGGGAGFITYPANPGVLVKIAVKVVDLSGNVISTVTAAASGYPLQTTPVTHSIPMTFTFSGLVTGSFTVQTDGTNCKVLGSHVNIRSMSVVGLSLVLTTLSGGSPVVKVRAWQDNTPSNGVSGSPESAAVSNPYDVRSGNLGNKLTLALELVSGTLTNATGTATVFYQESVET